MSDLRLTTEEQAMLAGEAGPALREAMEIVVALGRIYGAADLVPVQSVQVAGVSYKNLGDAGLEFLNAWAAEGARSVVPATLNPAGMDLARWAELGIPAAFARAQLAVVDAFARMGIELTLTCTPYLVGNRPALGDHVAWSESSAVSFANSVLGARTNREGGPSALAAAITGKTARYGLHLDERRRPTHMIEVRCPIRSEADLGALGALVGRQVRDGVPFFRGLDLSFALPGDWKSRQRLRSLPAQAMPAVEDVLKGFGAALAASGAVALYHVAGITPEADWAEAQMREGPAPAVWQVDDLQPGYLLLNGPLEQIDFVSLGCPHASLDELAAMANWLAGKRVKTLLWITVAGAVRDAAVRRGYAAQIEAAGGHLVADTCLVVAPVQALGVHSLATNSAKAALYAPGHSGLQTRFGTTEQCLEAAVTGVWPGGPSAPAVSIAPAGLPSPVLHETSIPPQRRRDRRGQTCEVSETAQVCSAPSAPLRCKSLRGRLIKAGHAAGRALASQAPIGFLGGVDPGTGLVVEPGHPLAGQSVTGRILVFPTGKGSTVGSYTIYRLAKNGCAPAGMICGESEPIVAVGAIIAGIPMVDHVPLDAIHDGDWVTVDDDIVTIAPRNSTG